MIGNYLRDAEEIYAQSFAIIRAEADLSGIPAELEEAVVRMIHACGMVDIASDIRSGGEVAGAVAFALVERAPVLCDCEAVRAGISRKYLPAHTDLVVTLNDPAAADLAGRLGTTRSAAGVELWRPRLGGAIVVIGNAPTALFHLLELLDEGAEKPAAIIATPVGFVGAAESKAQLALDRHSVPFLTLLGRRGGSAIASAALNAMARSLAS
jgi:precorrin-8X/cobalt-precorrin-8 methylmutase